MPYFTFTSFYHIFKPKKAILLNQGSKINTCFISLLPFFIIFFGQIMHLCKYNLNRFYEHIFQSFAHFVICHGILKNFGKCMAKASPLKTFLKTHCFTIDFNAKVMTLKLEPSFFTYAKKI